MIVAGGGIAGLCCAYELTHRGHDVTVLYPPLPLFFHPTPPP
ncbi:MAG: FAD-dependent oxidoreductase, partial [Bryobacteraceae bacterium]